MCCGGDCKEFTPFGVRYIFIFLPFIDSHPYTVILFPSNKLKMLTIDYILTYCVIIRLNTKHVPHNFIIFINVGLNFAFLY